MKADREEQSHVILTLFVDDGEESNQAVEAFKTINERVQVYHVRSLNMARGDEIEAPTLYAPEGIFRGWKQIQTFVRIPQNMRYKSVAAHREVAKA